jgi:hypothetical protein
MKGNDSSEGDALVMVGETSAWAVHAFSSAAVEAAIFAQGDGGLPVPVIT